MGYEQSRALPDLSSDEHLLGGDDEGYAAKKKWEAEEARRARVEASEARAAAVEHSYSADRDAK